MSAAQRPDEPFIPRHALSPSDGSSSQKPKLKPIRVAAHVLMRHRIQIGSQLVVHQAEAYHIGLIELAPLHTPNPVATE